MQDRKDRQDHRHEKQAQNTEFPTSWLAFGAFPTVFLTKSFPSRRGDVLDRDIWVSPARNLLADAFNETQINELHEGQGFPLGGETVKGIALTAHDQTLQAEFGVGGDMAAGGLGFFLAQAVVY